MMGTPLQYIMNYMSVVYIFRIVFRLDCEQEFKLIGKVQLREEKLKTNTG